MSEPRYISPMLDGFSLGQAISDHSGVACYPAMRDDSEKRYIVKKISLPASQVQVEALLLTGVYRDAQAVGAYYKELAQGVCEEVRILEKLAGQRGFVPYQDCQMEEMEDGIGHEVYLLSRYRMTLDRFTSRSPMTHLSAVNLGIDLCAALAVSREAGWLYVDLKPENVHLFGDQEYRIGDLGFVSLDSLAYASLPDRYRSIYTAPEVADAYSSLNATMDTYALGLVLYQIYNEGKLPFELEQRQQWLDCLANGEPVSPPVCADPEMAEIICKACAYNPEDRWQTPAQMGHALISYMQRNGADDIPIVPPAEPEPEPEEPGAVEEDSQNPVEIEAESELIVEETATSNPEVEDPRSDPADKEALVEKSSSELLPEEAQVEESADEFIDSATAVEEIVDAVEEIAEQESVPEENTPEVDWIDLMDAFLAEEEDGTEPATAEDEPTLRELMSGDVPDDAADLAEADLSAEAADILSVANELIEHEAPTPVVVPDPIDLPIPEPIPVEEPESQEPETEETTPAEPEAEPIPTPSIPEKKGLWKKVLGAAVGLTLTAAIAFGIWFWYNNLYLQTIDAMTVSGSGTQLTVTVETAMDHNKLTVICKDTYGNSVEGKLDGGVVTFSDLIPGSQYLISLEPDGFNKLIGSTSATYSTPRQTEIMHLNAVTGQEPGSAIISFGVEGIEPDEWTLTYSADGLEPLNVTFAGHSVTITDLTVGTDYTFTLSTNADVLQIGENTIVHTASDLVQAQNLAMSGYQDGVLSLIWSAPEGVHVNSWFVRCWNDSGYDQLLEVTEAAAAFEDIIEGEAYSVEVTAAGMTLGARTEIKAEASAISGFTTTLNGTTVDLSWNNPTGIPCTIECSTGGKTLQVITPEGNQAAYGPVAPGTTYTFIISSENATVAGTATVETPAPDTFSANKLDSETIIVKMYDVPSKNNWNYGALLRAKEKDTFTPGSSLALLYTVTKPYNFDKNEFESVFVIRDSEGKLVTTSSRTRSWDDMWNNGYCTETVSGLPAEQGDYTLSIYIANGLLTELPFTIK